MKHFKINLITFWIVTGMLQFSSAQNCTSCVTNENTNVPFCEFSNLTSNSFTCTLSPGNNLFEGQLSHFFNSNDDVDAWNVFVPPGYELYEFNWSSQEILGSILGIIEFHTHPVIPYSGTELGVEPLLTPLQSGTYPISIVLDFFPPTTNNWTIDFKLRASSIPTTNCEMIDLSTFSICNSNTISTINDDLSGVCYNYDSETLFAVINGTESIRELDLAGNELRQISLVGFWDTEGIAYMGNNVFAVTEEQFGRVVFITIPNGTSNITINYPGPFNYIQLMGSYIGNKGLEGIAYDYLTDSLFLIKEKNNIDLYGLHQAESLQGTTQPNTMVFDLNTIAASYPTVTGQTFSDAAGLSFTDYGTLLILSEEGKSIVEVEARTGALLSHILLPNFIQPEGLISISPDELIVVGEPNQFFYYSKDCTVPMTDSDNDGVPDGIDNCILQSNPEQKDLNFNGIGDLCDGSYTCNRTPGNTINKWVGPMIGNWYDDPCYWSKGSFPNPCDDVVIDVSKAKVILRLGSTAYGYTLFVEEESELEVVVGAVVCIDPY